ncbi:tRNA lysidine(34) synthetase TilS [Candidatus Saccharibacteria bacterium]|nr:tRNA lysidine(34) synthetase TilS [Candidatus Saccharibacteria bacterium]
MNVCYVIAVSGGVDSVSLLDMMARAGRAGDSIVAHFDHGIRDDSHEDAQFVEQLAKKYDIPFYAKREELGPGAGEALARDRRYEFLRELAKKHDARIVTAHHEDDLAETIAINLHRGTGWRGLAALDSDIVRPLLHMSKSELIGYAMRRGLEWREDSTNSNGVYLRNRLRPHIQRLPREHRKKIGDLRLRQQEVKRQIDQEVAAIMGDGPLYSRYILTHIPKKTALECLRVITKGRLTRPQMERLLLAVKTAHPGHAYEAGSGVKLQFSSRYFTL